MAILLFELQHFWCFYYWKNKNIQAVLLLVAQQYTGNSAVSDTIVP
jgi:hypothetical protein